VFWDLPFDEISEEHLRALITNEVREGLKLEYKEGLPGKEPKERREFLADVTAFANAAGGDILFGVREDRDERGAPTGLPQDICGLPGINVDAERLRIDSWLRNGVLPRLPAVRIREVLVAGTDPALLLRIPRSWAAPHSVAVDSAIRVYRRNSAGKSPLDFEELKRAILRAESIAERIRSLRRDRILTLESGESPAPLQSGPTTVIHLVPFGAFDLASGLDVSKLQQEVGGRIGSEGYGEGLRYTVDGFLVSDIPVGRGPSQSYTLVFRTGVIERAHVLPVSDEGKWLPIVDLHRVVMDAVSRGFDFYRERGISSPIAVLVSLLHAKGARIPGGGIPRQDSPIDRDIVFAPEVVAEDLGVEVARLLQPAFDLIWNSAGWPRARDFKFKAGP
jgi:hypothetical protein